MDHIEHEHALCPKHAAVAPFAKAQCPGCVGGWGDCPLWTAFAYSGRQRDICETDFADLERGVCPRRVNGTLMASRGRVESINLSEPAGAVAGKALADAIREYIREYP